MAGAGRARRVTDNPGGRARADQVDAVVARLRSMGNRRTLDGMARYAIPSTRAFGVPVGALRKYAKELGRDHALAQALWETGWYEARMLAVFLDEPELVRPEQMNAWRRDFDNWAICDTACFHLFDRAPRAFAMVAKWARLRDEFGKRAAFALLASLALHAKDAAHEDFLPLLPLIERAASDERNFVKKSVSWALRAVGKRGGESLQAAVAMAQRLAASPDATARWIGKDALRDLAKRRRTASSRTR